MKPLFAVVLLVASMVASAFDMQSHRGGRGLLPENTLAAFEHAIRMGTTTLELDIAITADGVPVVSHDARLNPALTRDASGKWLSQSGPLIKSLSLEKVQSYDVGRLNPAHGYAKAFPMQEPRDGQRIPTLAALFKLVNDLGANDVQFDIETKINPHRPDDTLSPEAFVKILLDVIRQAGMAHRVMVQSFDWRTLELLHTLAPEVRTVYLTADFPDFHSVKDSAWTAGHKLESFQGSVPHLVRAAAGPAAGVIWSPNDRSLTPEMIHAAHALGLQVIPWTVNDASRMETLIDWKVDGIISDYPDRLRAAMAKKGIALPQWKVALQMLHVEGTQWLRADGTASALKGVNLGNWLMLEFWMMGQRSKELDDQCTLEAVFDRRFGYAERERLFKLFRDNWITPRDWDLIPTFGLNLVRVPFIWNLVEDEKNPRHLRADAWHYLDDAIRQAGQRGLYVILDLHGAVGSQGLEHHSGCAEKNLYWTTPEFQERTAWLWQQIATRYKGNATVAAYGLLNEPWGTTATDLAAVMKRLYASVRAADPDHTIILPGHSSGIDAYGNPAQAGLRNVAFEIHPYPGHFGWDTPGAEVHRKWLRCVPQGTGVCEWRDRMQSLNAALFIGEFQPWADIAPDLGAQITRVTYDTYAQLGWAAAAWSYKQFSNSGGPVAENWGLVTNAATAPVAAVDFATATLKEIEDLFKRFGSAPYAVRSEVRQWLNSVVPPSPFELAGTQHKSER